MGAGAFIEPLVVVTLLFGGTYFNRDSSYRLFGNPDRRWNREEIGAGKREDSPSKIESGFNSPASEEGLLGLRSPRSGSPSQEARWRTRELVILGFRRRVTSPNTRVFRNNFLSRLLRKFPFLVEAWYWALIYWVYQLGRAFTAVTLVQGTVHVAREHALQLIHLEKRLHIFLELPIQHFFLKRPFMLLWINRVYSFIHIPGTILFLVWLFYFTTTRNRVLEPQSQKPVGEVDGSPAGPRLYEARRRTMAVCNLIAFIVFTLWPCMPPRLLSDSKYNGNNAKEAKSYGFIDTVHGEHGESSVWTQNKFCNQYAAMPSLHFGYSLLIGLTIATIPLRPVANKSTKCRASTLSRNRLVLLAIGTAYPLLILIAIIATANHFILDAVAGAMVCGVAWYGNSILLNLLALEDYFLWCVRIAKPDVEIATFRDGRGALDRHSWEKY
ncbi:MAG: hypothetical protein M1820_008387 [Bogoriella megaspora]|nr:MAG: hypothetical protein M1820_008387 [Bogoriella megaspora]